jgi:hypothetical protein
MISRKRLQCTSLDHRNGTVVRDVPDPSSQHMILLYVLHVLYVVSILREDCKCGSVQREGEKS